jgi:hypothetical protein
MPRTKIVRTTASLAGVEIGVIAANAVDGMEFQNNGNQVLFVDNGGGTSINVTIDMAPDQFGRDGSKVVAVPDGEQRFIGPFPPIPYSQDGNVHVDFSAATDVSVGVLSLQS